MSIILRSLMMHEMVSKAQRRLCSLIVLWLMKKKKDELLQQQNDNINSLENSLKIKTSNYRRLISYKDREEKEQFEFKDQQNVRFCWASEKAGWDDEGICQENEDNLDQLKTIPKDELKEDLKNAWQGRRWFRKKSKLLDELKNWTIKLKWRFTE
jgi:hypothetical protein